MDELAKIRKQKLEQYKQQFIHGGKNMENKWPNTPIDMSDSNIENYAKQYATVVVDCWAPWCGPCRMVTPIIEDLAKEMQGEIAFGKLNVDENQGTSQKYQIMSIPTLLVFKDGNLVDKIIGAMPKEILKQKLETYK